MGGTPEGLKYWITIHVGIDRTDFFHALFVIGFSNYWFVTDYIILMMVSPLLNLLLQKLKKEQLITTLAIATLFWSVIPTLSRSTSSFYESQNMLWCFVIYLYAGYIRLYADMGGNGRKNLLIAIASYGIVAFSGSVAIFLSGTEIAINDAGYLARFRSPLILIAGAELLLFALKAKPFSSRLINRMSSAVFGVYLIHENQTFRYFLWKYVLDLPDSIYYSRYFLVYACTIILGIYCVSTVIDLIRQQTIERLFMKLVDDIQPKASAAYEKTKQMLVRFVEGRNIQK